MYYSIDYVKQLTTTHEKKLLELLLLCDQDFTPTLSSSRLKEQPEATNTNKLMRYIEEKRATHDYLLAFKGEELVGFVNFVHRYEFSDQIRPYIEAKNLLHKQFTYINTMCVHPDHRGKGIGQQLYETLETIHYGSLQPDYIFRMTSKENDTQIHIFEKQGYHKLCELPYSLDVAYIKSFYYKKIKK